MIGWFPAPKKDQLLYDLLSEYHRKSMNLSPQHTMHDLFGSRTACAVFDMPNRLDDLCAQFSEDTVYSAEQFIRNHTLFPLYEPFLPRQRAIAIAAWMKRSDKGGAIHAAIGQMASSVPSVRFLRYCPECVRADTGQYGEPYWHRLHQITGVCICPEHETWLVETDVAPHHHKHCFQGLTPEVLAQRGRSLGPIGSRATCVKVAQGAEWLLDDRVPVLGLDELSERYRARLHDLSLLGWKGDLNTTKLNESFRRYYDGTFLATVGSGLCHDRNENWLTAFLKRTNRSAHPIRHILVQIWLGIEPTRFFEEERTPPAGPFGKGPWPCLNPAANHYRQLTISRAPRIHPHSYTRQPVGTFECKCGYVYRRNGPDPTGKNRFHADRVIKYGELWRKKLTRLMLIEHRGLRGTARLLGVDPGTVHKYATRIIAENLMGNNGEGGAPRDQSLGEPRSLCTTTFYRTRIKELVRNNKRVSRKEIRAMAQKEYAFLYRHDREELMKMLPPNRKPRPRTERVDWKRRDEQMAAGVKAVANEFNTQIPLVRITISAVGRRLGVLALIQGHLDRLPLTKAALKKACESVEDFQVRRVWYVAKEMIGRGEPLVRWRIKRSAGLRSNCSVGVATEIDRIRVEPR